MFNSGIRGRRSKDGEGITSPQVKYVQTSYPQPSITGYSITGIDDTALDPAGGQTIVVTGSGFVTGVSATLGGTQIGAVSLISPTQISFTSPAKAAGTYSLLVYNSTGGAAILVPGVTYSSFPTFTTAAGSIGSVYETTAINTSVTATSDSAVTYSLASGTLPAGSSLSSSGVITGTAPADSGSTTYTFSVKATDAELQDVTRTFTLTVNTDVLTWVTPSNNASIQLTDAPYSQVLNATDAAGYSVSYSANALPTGVTLSAGTISGTATVEGTTMTLLTATAATTNRTATNTITWTVTLNEAYWKYMPMLLSADSTSQPSSFVSDRSINNAQLTVAGDTRAHNFNPYQFGYYSAYFSGNGQYLSGSHPWLNIASTTVAWTFECWVYTLANGGYFFAIGSGSAYGNSLVATFGAQTANKFTFMQGNGSSANPVSVTSTNSYAINTWYHYAVSRTTAGVMTQYINGVADGTVTYNNATVSAGTTFVVNGVYDNNGLGNNGGSYYVSNLRFTINQALYTSNFTPSTSPLQSTQNTLLMLCQSPRFAETSQWGHAITVGSTPSVSQNNPFASQYQITTPTASYSNYFNGSSYLTIPSSANLLLGMTWTIEMWIYPLSGAKQQLFYVGGTYCYIESVSGGINLSKWSNGSNSGNYGGYVVQNAWNHVAWQCDTDGIVRGFINGIVAFASSGYSVNTQTAATIGQAAGANYYNGYISSLRVLKGTALYNTAGFTPPNSPLTAIANTVLLTCQNSTLVDNSTNAFTVTPTGSVTALPFYPAIYTGVSSTALSTTFGSAYFDGTGDYISGPVSIVSTLSGDWTVEAWCYMTVAPTGNTYNTSFPILTSEDNAGTMYHYWGIGSTAFVSMTRDSSSYETVAGTMPGANRWFHVAVTNVGTVLKVFIDGMQVGTVTQTAGTWNAGGILSRIGALYTYRYATGYICDLRVVNGTAVYTSNFVPSLNTSLTTVTNTALLTLQTNQSHNNTVHKDNSRINTLVTRNGNVTNGTFSPYGDNWGNYFDGTGDYMTMTYVSDIGNVVLASNSCVEMWIYPTSFTQTASGWPYLVCNGSYNADDAGWVFGTINGGYVAIKYGTSSKYIKTSTGTVSLNQWSHIAVTISGGNVTFYINGVQSGSSAIDYNGGTYFVNSAVPITIGAHQNVYYTGYISNLRISYGSAIYSAAFTPSTSLLQPSVYTRLLTAQSNRLIDNSYYNYVLTKAGDTAAVRFSPFSTVTVPRYYSTYFDGTSDWIYTPSSSNLSFGTGDFVIEAWAYMTLAPTDSTRTIISSLVQLASPGDHGIQVYFDGTSGKITALIKTDNSTYLQLNSTTSYALNTWYHVAYVRTGTTVSLFINGTREATGTSAINHTETTWYISRQYTNASAYERCWAGYISNLRMIKGTGPYNATSTSLTVSTSPLTAVANTVLVTCQDNMIKDNSTNYYSLTSSGDTKPLLVSPFTPVANTLTPYSASTFGGSMYFDGSGDNLAVASPASYTIPASGSFTVECWVYSMSATQQTIFNINDTGSLGYGAIRPQILPALTIQWLLGPAGSWGVNVTTGSINLNTWNHIAITRNVNSVYFFINGVQQGATQTYSSALATFGTTYIGTNTGTAYQLNGYVSDFRFINGVALYTSNFYPGSSPISPVATIGASTYISTLLLNGASGGVVDQTRTVDFETLGDAKVTQFSPYNGTYYSTYIPGSTGDYVANNASNAFAFGSGDFTFECWLFFAGSMDNNDWIITESSPSAVGWQLTKASLAGNSNNLCYGSYGGVGNPILTAASIPFGRWFHIAVCRSGSGSNNVSTYVDGTRTYQYTDTRNWDQSGVYIGARNGGTIPTQKTYISNLRTIKGTALYSGASFAIPTAPLTAVSGTSLLTCQNNKFVDNSTNAITLSPLGTVKVATQNPFQINSGISYYFDGTGDYCSSPATTASSLGTGSYTIECWYFYTGGAPGTKQLTLISNLVASDNTTWDLQYYNTGFRLASWSPTFISGTTSLVAGTWNHIAVTRNGTAATIWLNGVSIGTATDSTNLSTASSIKVGYNGNNDYWVGYITDVRITKGIARYTSTFTPPVTPLKLK